LRLSGSFDRYPPAVVALTAVCLISPRAWAADTNQPTEWIDADTGHRVVQLSTEPGSESLYFNLNFCPTSPPETLTRKI
jgi:hypothetical protein